jgi:hypothetical protein
MDCYGLKDEHKKFIHLETFLADRGRSPRPSVWRLRQILAVEEMNFRQQVEQAALEYGFVRCRNPSEKN